MVDVEVVAAAGGLVSAEVLPHDAFGGVAYAVVELVGFGAYRAYGKHTIHLQVLALGKATRTRKVVGIIHPIKARANKDTRKANGFVGEAWLSESEILPRIIGHEMYVLASNIEAHLDGIGRNGGAIDGVVTGE